MTAVSGFSPDRTRGDERAARRGLSLLVQDLGSDWLPHPWNPIVTDARAGRPAGRIFRHEDVWIRPAQDCSSRYGYATVFNRIEDLTVSTFRESRVAYLGPEWLSGNLGTHTYNRDSSFETVDGYRQHWRRPARRQPS